jgi:hypothetical protein
LRVARFRVAALRRGVLVRECHIARRSSVRVACCMLHVVACCCVLLRVVACCCVLQCCMLHVACCVLHDVAGCVLRVACCVLRVACCVLRVACCALRVAELGTIFVLAVVANRFSRYYYAYVFYVFMECCVILAED